MHNKHASLVFARRLAVLALTLAVTIATASPERFDFTAYGNFKRMKHTGDTSGQVKLADLPAGPGVWGMGALAGLKGEILMFDGRLLVSPGSRVDGSIAAPAPGDEATIFVTARVQEWEVIALPEDMTQQQFEAFVIKQATARGIQKDSPFPFIVEGRYPTLTWHVLSGKRDSKEVGDHAVGHAGTSDGMRLFQQPGAEGKLVGVYTGSSFEGIASHPGDRFHVHYADANLTVSGHLDSYAIKAGAVLKLARR